MRGREHRAGAVVAGSLSRMSDQTASPASEPTGFSSRWMLDGRTPTQAGSVAGDARASARAIDTDGDGVADTLALRVDAERESLAARIGGWLTRSVVTLLLVASLVAAAGAGVAYQQAREDLDRTTALLEAERAAAAEARTEAEAARERVAELEGAALEAERDQLAAENELLRGLLLDER